MIAALPANPKARQKLVKKVVAGVQLEEGETLAIVDTGSCLHAIDAEEELPDHEIHWNSDAEANRFLAETACGGILKRLGLVTTDATVDGKSVTIEWNHMRVKCPILSVVRLCEDGHGLWIHENGGEIIHTASGARMRFEKLMGVYYVRIKFGKPRAKPEDAQPLFSGPGA